MSTFPPPPPARNPLARVRLDDLAPFDGASTPAYASAVDAFAESLTRHSAAAVELPAADAAIVRCGLESARAFFRARPGFYVYRAGRYVCIYVNKLLFILSVFFLTLTTLGFLVAV